MLRKIMAGFILSLFLFNSMATAAEQKKPVSKATPIVPMQIDRTDFPSLYPCNPCLEGEAVWMVQARLKELGYDIEPNGVYNQATIRVVKLYQTAHGFKDTGIVNKAVWETIMVKEADAPCIAENNSGKPDKTFIEIDVSKRRLFLYNNDTLVKEYPVAVGKSSTPTPLGEWKIVQKSLNWGNGFGTRWMGLNVPWGIFGIHGTNKPGSIGTYASHGCIRMLNRHAEDLYPRVSEGTTVRITENGKMFPEDLKPVTLKKKASGQRVVYVQSRLKELGLIFDRADGRFGNMTELAVKYYQIWHDLEPTGIMDESTYRAMGMIKQ